MVVTCEMFDMVTCKPVLIYIVPTTGLQQLLTLSIKETNMANKCNFCYTDLKR